jgi:hypothetical protein
MGMIPLDLNPSSKKLRQFGWVSPIMLLALSLVLRWRFGLPMSGVLGFGLVGLILLILSRISVRLVRPVYLVLVIAGYPIGWVVSHLVMLLFYFGIITPLALIFRLFGRDMLHRRWEPERDTYWTEHPQCDSVERYFRQF